MRPIDADALNEDLRDSYNELRKIYDRLTHEEDRVMCEVELSTLLEVLMRIKKAPTLDVAPVVHGRWQQGICGTECSRCLVDLPVVWLVDEKGVPYCKEIEKTRFCPCCGAKMEGEK